MSTSVCQGGVKVVSSPNRRVETWRYRSDTQPVFDPVVFDALALRARGLVTGVASAGRGGTLFFTLEGQPLVLREYRRGGQVRHFSSRSYIQTGLERSRAMREFNLLITLESLGLPAPIVFAARRTRRGLTETGELVTHRLNGQSLAERASDGRMSDAQWANVGRCIARFHARGVEHADLNAHNILVDDEVASVHLLDFDRGRIHSAAATLESPWMTRNLERLSRSLDRLGLAQGAPVVEAAWRESLQGLISSASM